MFVRARFIMPGSSRWVGPLRVETTLDIVEAINLRSPWTKSACVKRAIEVRLEDGEPWWSCSMNSGWSEPPLRGTSYDQVSADLAVENQP